MISGHADLNFSLQGVRPTTFKIVAFFAPSLIWIDQFSLVLMETLHAPSDVSISSINFLFADSIFIILS